MMRGEPTHFIPVRQAWHAAAEAIPPSSASSHSRPLHRLPLSSVRIQVTELS